MTDTVHTRGTWTLDWIAVAHVAAVAPALAVAFYERGATLLPVLAVALAVTYFWPVLFLWSRQSLIGWEGIVTAIAFVILAPADVPLTQVVLALTFGVVIGEQIFGGHGRAFLNPAAAALVFLFLSFPASATEDASMILGAAALAGAALLIALGLASWRLLAGAAAGLAAMAAAAGMDIHQLLLTSGAFAVAVVYLGCHPVASPATNAGRLTCGIMIGFLAIALGYGGGPDQKAAAVFAVFLVSLFAPAVDRGAIVLHSIRMRRRRG